MVALERLRLARDQAVACPAKPCPLCMMELELAIAEVERA